MVNGSRYLNGNKKDTPVYRRLGQKVLDLFTNMDSGLSVTDSQSGFRAFSGQIKDAFHFRQNGLAIESEMLIMYKIINTEQECTLICLNTLYPSRSKNWKKEFI